MPALQKCRGCGADVPANAPFGHCPKCLLELGFGPVPEGAETSSPSSSPGGRAFGDYELFDQIGRGGMGVIYKARQISLNRPVALKMVSSGEFASPTMVQRFHLEAEAAANLHHPNIVPIYETGEYHGQHFFSMELIDGAGVDRYITGAGFCFGNGSGADKASLRARQEQIARVMAKVARAVDHAHQHGILHRDLKPSNVLLDRKGEPHLTDFGVAKVIGKAGTGVTLSGAIIGTPSYMAPEQAAGHSKRVTTAADTYSLGAVLYAMLTGQPPFRADTPVETLRQVVEQEPKHPTTFNDGIDRDLANICLKCMEKEPQRRYSSAGALADDLERWLRQEPILARPVGSAERAWRWCRRNPRVAVLSSAVGLLLVLLAVLSTVVAIHIAGKNKALDTQVGVLKQMMFATLGQMWTNTANLSSLIESDKMRMLLGKDARRPAVGQNLRLTFGTYFYRHPTNLVGTLAPALLALEDSLTERFGRPVNIDLRIFNRYQPAIDALASGEVQLGRVGPSSYVQLLDKGAPVSLLAVQDSTNAVTLAIFTRKDSKVAKRYAANTNAALLELIRNTSFAFGDTNSTTGYYLVKWFLVMQGVHAADLDRQENQIAQEAVVEVVSKKTFDLGAANRNVVAKNPDLVVLRTYPLNEDVGRCWVAAKTLDPAIAGEVQKWLLNLREPDILESLSSSEGKVTGFKRMSDAALNPLRHIMRRAGQFDSPDKQK